MDWEDQLAAHLLANLELKTPQLNKKGEPLILFRALTDSETGLAILDAPSVVGGRYHDKSRYYDYQNQIIVKSKNQKLARDEAMMIFQELDDLPRYNKDKTIRTIKSANNSFVLQSIEGVQLPRLIELTEHKAYMYTFLIKPELHINALIRKE